MKRIDLYDLKIGDRFVEEASYGDLFYCEVVEFEYEDGNKRVISKSLREENLGEKVELFYNKDYPAYAPDILLVEDGDDPLFFYGLER